MKDCGDRCVRGTVVAMDVFEELVEKHVIGEAVPYRVRTCLSA